MSVRSGQSVTVLVTTRTFTTGAATNADSLPTGTLYVNGTVNAAVVTVVNITAGLYKAQVTLPSLSVGDIAELRINATVSGVNDNAVVWRDTKDMLFTSAGGVVLGDGVAHGGTLGLSTATLSMQTIRVINPGGDGIYAEGGAGAGMRLEGAYNTHPGLWASGTPAILAQGLGDASSGFRAIGSGEAAVRILSDGVNVPGLEIISGADHGVHILGSVDKHDIHLGGSGTIWDGVNNRLISVYVAGGSVTSDRVMFSGTLGDQSAGGQYIVVLPSGPADDGVLFGSRLRIISGVGQYQERTITGWVGATKWAGIDHPWVATVPTAGDSFQVLYDNSYQLNTDGMVCSVVYDLADSVLAKFFLTDSGITAASAVPGSVVYEIATAGFDTIVVEPGINARQAMALLLAAEAGTLSGAETSTIVIYAAGTPGTPRITATIDANNNRTAVTMSPPV